MRPGVEFWLVEFAVGQIVTRIELMEGPLAHRGFRRCHRLIASHFWHSHAPQSLPASFSRPHAASMVVDKARTQNSSCR